MRPSPLVAVLHACTLDGDTTILDEQLDLLASTGLRAALSVVLVSHISTPADALQLPPRRGCVVIEHGPRFADFEIPTATWIRILAQAYPSGALLYLHTKGVRRHGHAATWRRYMQYFLVEQWPTAVDALAEAPAVGVDWLQHPEPHFSGNFWWARCDYLQQLPLVTAAGDVHRAVERWVLSGPRAQAARSLHQSGVNHYEVAYPRGAYDPECR